MNLAQNTNRYLDSEAPWHSIKTDKDRAGTTMWVSLYAISAIKTFLYTFMPNASLQLGNYLGISSDIDKPNWRFKNLNLELLSKHLFLYLKNSK